MADGFRDLWAALAARMKRLGDAVKDQGVAPLLSQVQSLMQPRPTDPQERGGMEPDPTDVIAIAKRNRLAAPMVSIDLPQPLCELVHGYVRWARETDTGLET